MINRGPGSGSLPDPRPDLEPLKHWPGDVYEFQEMLEIYR